MNAVTHFIGRVLLGSLFFFAGIGKVVSGAQFSGFIESKLPNMGFLAWPVSIFELVAGLFLILGFQTRITALLLSCFCIFTGVVYHGFAGQEEIIATLKNLALAGGYLLLFVHGAGKWALDKS